MSTMRALLPDLLLPGSGLFLAGRLVAGLALLVAWLPVPTVLLVAGVLVAEPGASWLRLLACGWWLGLALVAVGLHLWWQRRQHIDPTQVRALHAAACAHWLNGRYEPAVSGARALVRAAPEESGAWRFLALVARDAGIQGLARRATRQAEAIEQRAQ